MLKPVSVGALPPDRFRSVLSSEQAEEFDRVIKLAPEVLAGRVVWNVNSTANGGGVAEMLHSLIAYGRGAHVDSRWVVIEGNEQFFHVTKRIHNRLHGAVGDGGALGDAERGIYESVVDQNSAELAKLVQPGDIVLLHDPQTAGMAERLIEAGAHVIWRCHVGIDSPNDAAREAWDFLLPYVLPAAVYIFSRKAFSWDGLDTSRIQIIPPSIDAFSPKNQDLSISVVHAILAAAGIGADGHRGRARFTRLDGTPGRVDRSAQLWEDERLPDGAPLVLQVSRWDRLKDPRGVMQGFADNVAGAHDGAHLMLAGPEVAAVADDPEGLEVLQECVELRESLDPSVRGYVHLAALPMTDADENAAIVNALQRRATVVVQKSIAEGFGLTVAEAMWKGAPVVASRIGGIQDQIVDRVSGLLVDPTDLDAYAAAVRELLADPGEAQLIGAAARNRVRDSFLGARHLIQYEELFASLIQAGEEPPVPASA